MQRENKLLYNDDFFMFYASWKNQDNLFCFIFLDIRLSMTYE